jgi:hypothetical protein
MECAEFGEVADQVFAPVATADDGDISIHPAS